MKSLHWDITRKCNLRCIHCYNADKYFNEQSLDYTDKEMTLDEALNVVDIAAQNGFERIHLLGGEPLASPYLFSVIEKAKKYNMKVTMNSNATLLTSQMQDKLIDLGIDHYAASIDGATEYTNDLVRGAGTFSKVIQNMTAFNEKIKKSGSSIQTAIASTITKVNYHEIRLLPSLTRQTGCKLLSLATFVESGNGRKTNNLFTTDTPVLLDAIEAMIANELESNEELYLQLDVRPLVVEYLHNKYNARILYNINNSLCCAGEDIWYLEADGHVHPCLVYRLQPGIEAQKKGIFSVESIKFNQYGVQNVVNSVYWESFLSHKHDFKHSLVNSCKGCSYIDVCTPCPFEYGVEKKEIPECEWVWQRLEVDLDENKDKIISIDNNIEILDNYIIRDGVKTLYINEMVSYMIELVQKTKDSLRVRDLIDLFIQEYDASERMISRDIMFALNGMISRGIVELS